MARTSTRRAAIKANEAFQAQDGEEEVEVVWDGDSWVEEDIYAAPPAKRARTSVGGGGRTRIKGSLRGILSLPLETLTSICLSLDLETVFHLSRLNKQFWRFLRDPSVKYVWDEVRKRGNVPEMQLPGLDVYGLANLLFGCCMGCGKKNTKVDYVLRVRSCNACSSSFIYKRKLKDPLWSTIEPLVTPSEYDEHDRQRHAAEYSKQEVDTILDVYRQFQTKTLVTLEPALPQLNKKEKASKAKGKGKGKGKAKAKAEERIVPPEFRGLGTFGQATFMLRCEQNRQQRTHDAHAIANWKATLAREKQEEVEKTRLRRRTDIENRFKAIGWKEHHFDATFRAHPTILVAKELDERTWLGIKDTLEELLRQQKAANDAALLAREVGRRKQVVQNQYDALLLDPAKVKSASLYPLPPWSEFSKLQKVQPLYTLTSLKDFSRKNPSLADHYKPIAEELSALRHSNKDALFAEIVEVLKGLDQALADKKKKNKKATRFVPPALTSNRPLSSAKKDAHLLRAVFVALCTHCSMVDSVPRLAGHTCQTSSYLYRGSGETQPSILRATYAATKPLVQAAVDMVLAAGQEADVSVDEMEQLGRAFTCLAAECAKTSDTIGRTFLDMLVHVGVRAHASGWGSAGQNTGAKIVYETKEEVKDRLYELHRSKPDPYEGKRGTIKK